MDYLKSFKKYITEADEELEETNTTGNLDGGEGMRIGVGFSLNILGNLYLEPNYDMPLSKDAGGNRDGGDFDLGLSYKF